MARTKQQLATDALRKLGVLAIVDTASAEDAALVEARYDDMLSELRDKGLAYWTHASRTSEDIPDAVFGAVVGMLAENIAPYYGAQIPTVTDDSGRPVTCGTKGLRDLRRHMAKPPSGEPTRADYF